MKQLSHTSFLIALHVDGVLPEDDGGSVTLSSTGKINLNYPVRSFLQESFQESMKQGARLALAAGATTVHSLHFPGVQMKSEADLEKLDTQPYGALHHGIFTAHQMGGLGMGIDPKKSVVNAHLQHHRLTTYLLSMDLSSRLHWVSILRKASMDSQVGPVNTS